ncbi:hypothetical protein J5N97_018901 [Dioscorea zingiberensis]|uniref:Uncharacterized protein n=1 Tax=Dioscorea zingiberensis TaxID=325984 RepID=A0A9D5CD05_9LILI|nr:hypothetical protein J5N97_018901 [Dioscorea zingiberensis]
MAANAHSEAMLLSQAMSSRSPSSRAKVAKKHESLKIEKPWSLRPPYWLSCLKRKVRALKTWYVGNAPISASKHLEDEMVSLEPYFSLPVVQATQDLLEGSEAGEKPIRHRSEGVAAETDRLERAESREPRRSRFAGAAGGAEIRASLLRSRSVAEGLDESGDHANVGAVRSREGGEKEQCSEEEVEDALGGHDDGDGIEEEMGI